MAIRDLRSGGYFVEKGQEPLKNTLTSAGALRFLRAIFRGEAVLPANYYIGLTNSTYTALSTLANIAVGEPVGNGYARIALAQNTSDWTAQLVNGVSQAKSKTAIFTASADWDKAWQRAFICDQATGTAGVLYSVSGPAPALRTVLSGAAPSISYEYWLRG